MNADERIRNRLDELIKMGESVLATKRSLGAHVIGDDRVDTQLAHRCVKEMVEAVRRLMEEYFA
jgi:hypothetical protein